tara:strand:- start:32064 stop:32399 length:336 start_codon:yes stop_codon:yes gene_type:complete
MTLSKEQNSSPKTLGSLIRSLTLDLSNYEDSKQLTRSSGSVGANYIEANEKLGDKDFKFRAKIARKEAKESRYWLRLIDTLGNKEVEQVRIRLEQEATELLKILSAIINKV